MDWVKKYINCMLKGDDEEALLIKAEHFPKSFFKYRVLNKNTLENLKGNWLWLATIDSLNDPFECSLLFDHNDLFRSSLSGIEFPKKFKEKFNVEITKEEIEKVTSSSDPQSTYSKICEDKGLIVNVNAENITEKAKEIWGLARSDWDTRIQICSFSACYDSLLMWSHYADQHKGICIEYDFIDCDEIRPFLQPVLYDDKIFKIKSFDEMNAINNIMASIAKSKDWSYEKEWRLTYFTETQLEKWKQKVTVPIPKAIYLGTRFELNEKDVRLQLEEITNSMKIPIYKMNKHQSEYRLVMQS
jgi:hypothetical protein